MIINLFWTIFQIFNTLFEWIIYKKSIFREHCTLYLNFTKDRFDLIFFVILVIAKGIESDKIFYVSHSNYITQKSKF